MCNFTLYMYVHVVILKKKDLLFLQMKAAGKNRLMDSKLKCVFETEDENSPKQV